MDTKMTSTTATKTLVHANDIRQLLWDHRSEIHTVGNLDHGLLRGSPVVVLEDHTDGGTVILYDVNVRWGSVRKLLAGYGYQTQFQRFSRQYKVTKTD